jgi:hypothetical protein
MAPDNYERMLQLVEEIFATKNDRSQLGVNEEVIKRLQQMHPASLAEERDENGPIAWVLLIPTTLELMNHFVQCCITEQELFRQTPLDISYEVIYLCSALILPEYRRKGLARRLTIQGVESIRKDHPIQTLCVWPFSKEGDRLAEVISVHTTLPLFKRLS